LASELDKRTFPADTPLEKYQTILFCQMISNLWRQARETPQLKGMLQLGIISEFHSYFLLLFTRHNPRPHSIQRRIQTGWPKIAISTN
jgi:hypothetical protein